MSGRWTDGLVWYCSLDAMGQRIKELQHIHTHTPHTHRLMTPIQMACLLCVCWPALKGIFHLLFFFLTKESVQSAQLSTCRFFLLMSQLIPNCAHSSQTSVFTVATLFRHTLPVFGWTILTVTITTVPVTNAATLACFFFSYISAFFPCSYNSS